MPGLCWKLFKWWTYVLIFRDGPVHSKLYIMALLLQTNRELVFLLFVPRWHCLVLKLGCFPSAFCPNMGHSLATC
jgi:hypothetical protein